MEPITKEEFVVLGRKGRTRNLETVAMLMLAVGTGGKFPCRWKHYPGHSCGGMSVLTAAAKRNGRHLTQRCKDGVLYVWRIA